MQLPMKLLRFTLSRFNVRLVLFLKVKILITEMSYEKLIKALVIFSVMWRERQTVRRERTVAPRRAGTKGKGSIRPLCLGGGAIAHNERMYI